MKIKTVLYLATSFSLVLIVALWLLSRIPRDVYSYATASYFDIVSTMTVSGKITPEREVEIRPRISAYVSDILVECGDKVKKGQRLVRLEAIPDVFALEEANAALELEKIALRQAQTDFERAEKLYEGNSISTKEYELAQNGLDVAEERLMLALNRRNIIVNGCSKRSSEYDESIVRSPIDGVISSIQVTEGETVSPIGKVICTVADNGPLVFKGNVDETDISSLKKGLDVELVLGAYPNIVIPARLVSISSFGRSDRGFTQFEIEASLISVPEGVDLHSGFSANAKIAICRAGHVLSVPEECIRLDMDRTPYVWRLTSNPANVRRQRWEKVPVTLGISDGVVIQITSGLEENNLIQTSIKKKI